MVIKVSTLLEHNTVLSTDTAPTLGGPLNTNNYPIENGGNPVTITGNEYPINTGAAGQVLTTNGLGVLSWQNSAGGTVIDQGTTSADYNILFTNQDSGSFSNAYVSMSTLTYNPSTGFFTGPNIGLVGTNEITLDTGDSILINQSGTNYGEITPNISGGIAISSQGALDLTMMNGLQINNVAGTTGQVLTSQGPSAPPIWTTSSGSGTVTSVGLTSTGGTITVSGTNPITSAGTFNVDLPTSGVTAATYGSASQVGVFTVNPQGILTSASNTPISITPTQAGLGNVVNSLQVINAGGAPSIQEATGVPSSAATTGALYVDQGVTNGNGLYFYNGTSWVPISQKLKLYAENSSVGYVAPTAAAQNSIALGEGAQSNASDSLAIGLQSLSRIQGGVVQASGRFASSGDAQTGRYLVRNITTNNAPTTLFVDGVGGSVRLVLADMSTWTFKITITGHRTDAGDGHAGYEFTGVIYRQTGATTTAILNKVSKSVVAESNVAWDANVVADNTNGALQIIVTGEIGKVIRWLALVETVEITN